MTSTAEIAAERMNSSITSNARSLKVLSFIATTPKIIVLNAVLYKPSGQAVDPSEKGI